MKYDLTIGIPTYNRADKLEISIKAIMEERNRYPDKNIEVLVSDNCSSDDTFKVVSKFENISYYRNEQNLGFDLNVDSVIKKAKADYVLIMSDDDILLQNSLGYYFDTINNSVVVAIGRARFMDSNCVDEIPTFSDAAFDNFQEEKIYYFQNGVSLIEFTKKLFCGISGIMFNKNLYLEENLAKFFNSQFIHTAAMFSCLSHENALVAIINHKVLMYRLGGGDSPIKKQDDIVKVGFGLLDLLNQVKVNYPKSIYYTLYNKELDWVRRLMIGIKSRESLNKEILVMYNSLLDEKRDKKYIDLIINYIPDFLFKIPYMVYRFIKYGKVGY